MVPKPHILVHWLIGEKRIGECGMKASIAFNYPLAWRYYNNKVKRFKRLKLL